MPSTYITEGEILTTIFDFIKKIHDARSAVNKRKYGDITTKSLGTSLNMSSIARASKDLTMSFPVLCSDTITPQTATMITKAIERNNISMLQMLIAAYHINANNGIEAIRMIHTNMDNVFRAEDLVDAVMGVKDSGVFEMTDIKNITSCKRPPINYARLMEEAKIEFLNSCNIKYPESSFSENSIADYTVTNRFNNEFTVLKEVRLDDDDYKDIQNFNNLKTYIDNNNKNNNNGDNKGNNKGQRLDVNSFMNYTKTKADIAYRKQDVKLKGQEFKYRKDQDTKNAEYISKRDAELDARDAFKARRELFFKQLLDSDVKKANELQPTLMVIPFYYEDSSGTERSQEFVAGVKSRLITVSSDEIIDQISRFNKQGVNLNNLIRATTKEISLSKEFIGGIEQAKIDAKRDSKLAKTSPIWRCLQSRSSRSGIQSLVRTKGSKNAAAAITTLVITSQEADYILENYNVDIANPVIAREFMSNYNLLCLIIIDEQTEVAKFLYDGEKYFSDYSFSALDRDNNSNDTRKLISLLNKTR